MFWHSLFFVGTMKCRSQWIWLVKRREFPVWMQLICEKMTALHAAPARRINSCLILFVDFISWRQLLVCYLWFYYLSLCMSINVYFLAHSDDGEMYHRVCKGNQLRMCSVRLEFSQQKAVRCVSICNKHQWPLVIWENLHPLLPYLKTPFAYELFLLHIKQRQTKT